MKKSLIIALTVMLISLFLSSTTLAQDTLLISYQGRLTDDGGDPITGTPSMTFTIYDAGGVSKWSESHSDVPVANGLFSVTLGTQTALPDSVFNGDDRYLGISIEGDDETTPRTQLTSSPGAAVSRRVAGDIKTLPGVIEIHPLEPCVPPEPCTPVRFSIYPSASEDLSENNQPVIEMESVSDTSKFVMHPPVPCVPPDPCNPSIEITSTAELNSININQPPSDDNRPAIKLMANNENMIELFCSEAESDEGIVQIGSDAAKGGFIELHGHSPLTVTRVMMGGSTTDTGYVRLFGGDNDAEYKLLELTSHTNTGGNINFFDPASADRRELLSIGSAPLADEGIGIYGFNPQPEPPGDIAFEMTSDGQGGRLALYDTTDANSIIWGGSCTLTGPDAGTQVNISSGLSEAGIIIINNQPTGESAQVDIDADTSQAGIIIINNLEGGESSSIDLGVNTSEAGIIIVNTQPSGESSAINMQTTSDQTELRLSNGDGVDDFNIALRTTSTGASIGIGTIDPSDELYVVGDITATGAITELSSLKYKTDINQLDNALKLVESLRGVKYKWRSNEYPEMKFSEDQQVGLIAEEVEKVIPPLVHSDDNGEKSVDYSKLSAVLIEAIKDQQRIIEELANRVEELEGKKISER